MPAANGDRKLNKAQCENDVIKVCMESFQNTIKQHLPKSGAIQSATRSISKRQARRLWEENN